MKYDFAAIEKKWQEKWALPGLKVRITEEETI